MSALQELRARLNAMESFSRRESFSFSGVEGGLPRGGLVEITGHGKTEAVARFLAEQSHLSAAWIEKNFSLFPTALLQRNVLLQKVFFVEGGKDSAWAAGAVLRSQLFPILVYSAPYGEERELRRFQLLSERSKVTTILLGEKPTTHSWPLALSLEMNKGKVQVVKRRRA